MLYKGFSANQSGITTGTSVKTLVQLVAATNHQVKMTDVHISFNGTTNTDAPVLVELVRQTSAGTMSSLTLQKLADSDVDALDTTAQHTATAEPTDSGAILWTARVHPQQGWHGRLPKEVIIGAGDRVGLRVTSAVSYSAAVTIFGDETNVKGFSATVQNVSCTGGVAKTLMQLVAAANHPVVVKEIAFSTESVLNTNMPVLVELVRQSTAGTSSSLTLQQLNDSDGDTLDTTALQTFTAEPTQVSVLFAQRIHPQPGLRYPIEPIVVGSSDRLGLRVTTNENLDCYAEMVAYE